MSEQAEREIGRVIAPDETLLWADQPGRGSYSKPIDLVWLLLVVAWLLMTWGLLLYVIDAETPYPEQVLTKLVIQIWPLLVCVAILVAHRMRAMAGKRTFYSLTERRVLWLKNRRGKAVVESLPVDQIERVRLTGSYQDQRRDVVIIPCPRHPRWLTLLTGPPEMRLRKICDAPEVQALINQARRRVKDESDGDVQPDVL